MEKAKENLENNLLDESSEEGEEKEEFDIKNRKNKFLLTEEEIKAKYEEYLNCKLKYPKSQFCYFYFKGTCLLGAKCQFCHGFKEFSMDRFFIFLKDEEALKKSSQKYYQKFYFNKIIPDAQYTYDNLLEYQENHPEHFKHKYTFEELQKSRKKRLKIRKLLSKDIIEQFLQELFNRFNYIKKEDLFYYIENVGYTQSIKQLLKNTKICFSKNIKEGKDNKLYYIKANPDEMINHFIKILISHMSKGKYNDFFPINFAKLSKIIFMNTNKYDPTVTIYIRLTNTNENKFMNDLLLKLIEESNKGNFDLIKNRTIDDLIGKISYNNSIKEIYESHYKLNKSNFCCINYDDIIRIFYNKIEDKANQNFNLDYKLKYEMFEDGNVFFFNNEDELISFNYNKFKSFNINEFYNNEYYSKNCFPEKENNNIIPFNENNIEENEIKLNQDNIYNLENTIIKFINDENSLKYFSIKSHNFEVLSIDIEGDFDSKDIRINLIQICDDTNSKNDIYVIDFETFKNGEKEIFNKLSILLKSIFENKNIKKIFFDGRSDLLSLHKELNICVNNYIDLSSLYNAVNSFQEQYKFKISEEKDEKKFNKCLKFCKQNFYCKGLNTVLKNFHSNNCINPLKEKYHKLFKEKEYEYWAKRPIIKEFLLYSALDVKYEFDTYNNLKNCLKNVFINFYGMEEIENNNIDLVILLISCRNHKAACNDFKKYINNE